MTAGSAQPEPDFEHAIIARQLSCRRCGYDLRGLHIHGRCPECGFDVWTTVRYAIDPAATRLPRLRNPRRVGDGLLLLVCCLVVATLLIIARPVAMGLDAILQPGQPADGLAMHIPPTLPCFAAAILMVGILPVILLAPPRREESRGAVRSSIWMLSGALVAWSLLAAIAGFLALPGVLGGTVGRTLQAVLSLLYLLPAVVILVSLRRILEAIGERSREYRTARGGRQRLRDMIAAAVALGAGEVIKLAGLLWKEAWVGTIGTVIVWVSMFMLLIGCLYLLVNAWWIRRALRRPPPTLEELVMPEAGEAVRGEGMRE